MAGELQIDEFLLKQAMTSKKKITRENAFSFAQTYTSHLYRFRFIRAYIKPEPNQISLAFVSLETPVAEEKKNVIHIFMVATVEGVDFSYPIITELRKFCCNFAYGYSL